MLLYNLIFIYIKVEVENWDTRQPAPKSYWLASIIKLNGYYALLRYDGFDEDDSKDFWVNVAEEEVYHVGWCASFKKPLIPPLTIQVNSYLNYFYIIVYLLFNFTGKVC